ncbi:FUSC family protein [Streptomyces sp. SID2999]|uniref:FUSC family protein n=1 Tax=Streptomyces sp. SID2999 TaxID=2690258 RepID=UPI0019289EDD|nr:FUSC family protein [Streptomyces sp. SID2999]
MSSRRLPLVQALRLQGPSAIWFKPALSVVVSAAPPNLLLLALGRLDLALYTMAGSLCALYAHQRPYATRARVLAGVVLGMTAGLAVALLASALAPGSVVLVLVGALLAAAQKTVCETTRVGPPGNVVVTFISSAALFVPQTPGQVPAHLGLALAAGAWAWVVCMAPGVLRPHGPERRAVAAALHAAADLADQGHAPAHAALHTAWQALRSPGVRPDPTRRALENLLLRAETADADPGRLRAWAQALRGTGPVPQTEALQPADAHPRPARIPFKHLAPIATRTALGCALAGLAALSLGVGRPYWALVTAASLYQANVTLTWNRSVQRVVGNLLGVLVFAALTPLTHLHPVTLVLCCLACSFGAEALIARNYWLGTVCVTPMALLITEFTHLQDPGLLITQRVLDTLVGALAGFAAALLVTNRRAGDRVHDALTAVENASAHTEELMAHPAPRALPAARRALAMALTDLGASAAAAQGEWWQRPFPAERLALAEQAGHRTLAAAVRHRGVAPLKQDLKQD